MKVIVKYNVVVSINICRENNRKLGSIRPKFLTSKKFQLTEKEVEEKEYYRLHRKYVGIISAEELKKLIEDCYFTNTCNTMGILDAFGITPAISFDDSDSEGFYINMYAGPIVDLDQEEELVKEINEHPTPQPLYERVGLKLDQCLKLLEKYFEYECVGKSFLIDTKQLFLDFKGGQQN